MSLVEDKQVVEAVSSRRLHPPLRNCVRPGRSERRSHLLDAETLQAAIESRAIATVTIANQEPRWQSTPSAALHQLLGYSLCRRKRCYRDVQDFSVHVLDYKKDIEHLKRDCVDAKKSPAHTLDSWRFKNFRQAEDGSRPCREFIYFATVLAETVPESR
jgi:hypothetical protein